MCNRSLKQTAISLSSCEAEFYAASACAGELLGQSPYNREHARNETILKGTHNTCLRLELHMNHNLRCFVFQQFCLFC